MSYQDTKDEKSKPIWKKSGNFVNKITISSGHLQLYFTKSQWELYIFFYVTILLINSWQVAKVYNVFILKFI